MGLNEIRQGLENGRVDFGPHLVDKMLAENIELEIDMACPNGCKVEMVEKRVERLYHKNEAPIIVKNLPIKVCPECGQEAIPLSSMRIIDDILKGKVKSTGTLHAPVFQAA